MSAKAAKEELQQQAKVKKALQQGNREGARIYAENAIRKKNESNNFLRMSSRLDAVAQRINTAIQMRSVVKDMGKLVRGLDAAMASMDLEKISTVMDQFERQFTELDVHAQVMENSMGVATSSMTPVDQVDALIQQVADQNGLEIRQQLDQLPAGTETVSSHAEEDALTQRLAKLRQQEQAHTS